MVGYYQEVSYSEADEPLPAAESVFSGHEGPISLGIDSSSAAGPNESPLAESTDMQLSGLAETHHSESVDTPERDSQSPPPRSDVGASSNIPTVLREADSRQPSTPNYLLTLYRLFLYNSTRRINYATAATTSRHSPETTHAGVDATRSPLEIFL